MRILYLDLDTLRADHLGCYGYRRNTSPNIDRIAAEGAVFENYYCSDAPCLPSRAALMSGQFGIHTGQVGHDGTAADRRHDGSTRSFSDSLRQLSLPNTLARAGCAKRTYVGGFGERHSSYSFYAGFNEICDTGKRGVESAEEVTPTALDWLERNGTDDHWFLHVNYWDPHTPYRAPADFGNPFADEPMPDWITADVLAEHNRLPGPHTAQDINMWDNQVPEKWPRQPGDIPTMERLKDLFDGYDCGIRYMDQHIGKLLDKLEDLGVLDDLMIIVSADHGENFGELGLYAEHATADHPTCRIPFIVRWPQKVAVGGRRRALHYNLDLAPTLAELFQAPPRPEWDGRSFATSLLGDRDEGRDELILSQCAHVCQRSVRWDRWLYIRTYHDGFHLFDHEMLFDLEQDPHEQNNLATENPDLVKEAVYRLSHWHERMMKSQPGHCPIDPLWKVIEEGGPTHAKDWFNKNYSQRLRETGRGYAVKLMEERHPEFFRKNN